MPNESAVHIKKEKEREIRHPSDDPNYAERVEKGKVRIANGDMKFANEGDRMDYEKRVASNPMNTYGLPAFFPPLTLKQMPVTYPARKCMVVTKWDYSHLAPRIETVCGGCCTRAGNFICPRCGKDNS